MTNYIQVITTFETKSDAERTARSILEKRYAACIQVIGPIASMYWWNDRIENSEEYLCIIKSRDDLFTELEQIIKKLHPYDVPEILSVPLLDGNSDYLEWMSKELKP